MQCCATLMQISGVALTSAPPPTVRTAWWICRLWARAGRPDGWHGNDFRHSGGSITAPEAAHVHRAALARDKTRFSVNPSVRRRAVHHPSQTVQPAAIVSSLSSGLSGWNSEAYQSSAAPSTLICRSSARRSHSFVIYLTLSFHNAEDPLFNLYFAHFSQMSIIPGGLFSLSDKRCIKFSFLCVSQFFILLLLIFFLEILFIMLFFIYQDEVRCLENPWCLIYPVAPLWLQEIILQVVSGKQPFRQKPSFPSVTVTHPNVQAGVTWSEKNASAGMFLKTI